MGDEKFEYLPQLIVANDSNEIPNLIHITGAKSEEHYYCPCCGGEVRPRAINSEKEQAHYYHISGTCSKESQLYFFCKNWLFDAGSKFYLGGTLYEVIGSEINKSWSTPFGDYTPDVSVSTTQGQTIFFEMFFNNRKTDTDYFCKWQYLNNPVVEVDLRHYMMKTTTDEIPAFGYLYFDGECFCKPYVEKDVYARTIGRSKHFLSKAATLENKIRIEKLDKFWAVVKKRLDYESVENFKIDICNVIQEMTYEDQALCLKTISGKYCLKSIKPYVIKTINDNVINNFVSNLDTSYNKFPETFYVHMRQLSNKKFYLSWKFEISNEHCQYSYISFDHYWLLFSFRTACIINENFFENKKKIEYYLKISYDEAKNKYVSVNHYLEELSTLPNDIHYFITNFKFTVRYKDTVIIDSNNYEDFSINDILNKINQFDNLEYYSQFAEKLSHDNNCVINVCNCKKDYEFEFLGRCYPLDGESLKQAVFDVQNEEKMVEIVNVCKNKFWSMKIVDKGRLYSIDQTVFIPSNRYTEEVIYAPLNHEKILFAMRKVMKNMERCGYRVMEV